MSAVYGAFSAGAVFEVVDIAGLDYVAAMFALNGISSYLYFMGVCITASGRFPTIV